MRYLSLLIVFSGCNNLLNQLQGPGGGPAGVNAPKPPTVTVANVQLVQHPSAELMARALCPEVAPTPFLCQALGATPTDDQLRFTFDVQLDITNPNNIPLPVVEALAAFTAFPGAQADNLGAVCISLCQDGQSCTPAPDACQGGTTIKTAQDFTRAAVGFLFAVATGQTRIDELKIKTIDPNGHVRADFQLGLNPRMVMDLVKRLGTDAIAQVKQAKIPQLAIPYSIEGSVWVNVQSYGKIGAGYGPVAGNWQIN
jgi:hypothetical protein